LAKKVPNYAAKIGSFHWFVRKTPNFSAENRQNRRKQ
jgi:hypothetical protein